MNYNFDELIDVSRLQLLTDELYRATSIPSAIITMDGEILTCSGWQRICTDFHRKHPDVERECIKSNTAIRKGLSEGKPYVIYKCPLGLVDSSAPIIIEEVHVASVFCGQVFLTPPDGDTEKFFRKQAGKFEFDEEKYIEALREVPVFTEERFHAALAFLSNLAVLLADLGLARLQQLESNVELQQSELRHRTLLEEAPDGIGLADPETGLIIDCNRALAELVEREPSELIGQHQRILHPTPAEEEYSPTFTEHVSGKDREVLETKVITKSGQLKDVEIKAGIIQLGERAYLQGFFRDVTERKRSEQALLESEDRFRQLANSTWEGIVIHDDGIVLECNDLFCQMFGYQPEELIGEDGVSLTTTPESTELIRQQISLGNLGPYRATGRKKDGTEFPIELRIRQIKYEGRWVRVAAIRDMSDKVQAELELLEQKNFLQKAQEIGSIGTWILDIGKNELVWTDENYRIFGVPIGTPLTYEIFLNCVHPADREYVDTQWKAAFMDNQPYDIEHRLLVNGEVKWVREKAYLDFDEHDRCIRGVGVTQDISKRKLAELVPVVHLQLIDYAATHSVKELLMKFLDEAEGLTGSKVGFYHFADDAEKTLTLQAWSTNTLKNMCTAEGEGAHYPISDAGVWVDCVRVRKPVIHNDYANLKHKKGLPEGHAPIIRELVVPVIRGNNIVAILGVGNKPSDYDEQDVRSIQQLADTAWEIVVRKQAEEALFQSETRFRSMFEMHSAMMLLIDPATGEIVDANASASDFYGYSRDEFQTMNISRINQLTNDEIKARRLSAMAHRENHSTFLHRLASGEQRWVEVHSSPIDIQGSKIMFSVIHDITRRKRLEEQLRQTQKLEAIGTLAGGIAHDFNNILFAILGNADLAARMIPGESPARGKLHQVMVASNRAVELVKQILTFARKSEKSSQSIEVASIVKEAVKLLRSSLPTTISINLQLNADNLSILADPTEIHQVVMNLCTNASQAMMEQGGLLELILDQVALGESDTQTLPTLESGNYLMLSVSDTGPGIPLEVQERIFEPFFTTKATGQGTGMGLAVVHGIVNDLGGAIIVNSEVGQGTTFKAYFPLVDTLPSQEQIEIPDIPRGTERLMVVDDEPVLADMLKEMLELLGYAVESFSSSGQALAAFLAAPDKYDVIITDQTMPSMTGAELSAKILAQHPRQPIILTSGFSQTISLEKASQIGISAYLNKPLTARHLATTIRNVLDSE